MTNLKPVWCLEALLHVEPADETVEWMSHKAGGVLADGAILSRHPAGECPFAVLVYVHKPYANKCVMVNVCPYQTGCSGHIRLQQAE